MSTAYHYSKASLKHPREAQKYSSDAFRILRLFPGQTDSDLECNISVRKLRRAKTNSFKEPPKYDALSYTWGPQDGDFRIKIVADDDVYSLKIGQNLDAALRELRSPHEFRYLWVDAICIDQEDKEEKSVQIPLMKDIYNDAECVRIWLGCEENESSKAMDFIMECTNTELFDQRVKDAIATRLWAAVSALMRRAWFSRRWIIQEIALARKAKVHCGQKVMGWRKFASVIGMLADAQPQLKALFRESVDYKNHPDYLGDLNELGAIKLAHLADNLLLKDTHGKIDGRSLSLEALIASLTAFEASENHDVIYAILWLADDAHPVTKNAFTIPEVDPDSTNGLVPISRSVSRRQSATSPVSAKYDHSSFKLRNGTTAEQFPPFADDSLRTAGPSPAQRSSTTRGRSGTNGTLASAPTRRDAMKASRSRQPTLGSERSFRDAPAEPERALSSPAGLQIVVDAAPLQSPELLVASPTTGDRTRNGLSPNRQPGHKRLPSIKQVPNEEAKRKLAGQMFLSNLERRRIIVDYEKPAFEVYKDFLELAVRESRSLDILCIPWAPADPELPSWIPQLSASPFAYNSKGILRRTHADPLVKRPGHTNGGSKPYRAARSLPAVCQFGSLNEKTLKVRGFVLDRIKRREKEAVDGVIPSEWMDAVEWTDQSKTPPEIFWRTLVGNLNSAGDAYAPINWEISCKDAFRGRAKGVPLNTSDVLLDCSNNVRKFLERVQRVIWSRRLVLLERHHKTSRIALTPAAAEEGDLICILHGCSVPVVLREMFDEHPAISSDTILCYNCEKQGHTFRTCKRRPLDQAKISSNEEKYSINVKPTIPATPRTLVRRRGSCPLVETLTNTMEPRRYYKLIGECYVHRMMNGEAFRGMPKVDAHEDARKLDSIFWQGGHGNGRTFELR